MPAQGNARQRPGKPNLIIEFSSLKGWDTRCVEQQSPVVECSRPILVLFQTRRLLKCILFTAHVPATFVA